MRLLCELNNFSLKILLVINLALIGLGTAKAAELPNFADLVELNRPTIVEISTSRQMEARSALDDQELEELLRRLNPGQDPELEIEELRHLRTQKVEVEQRRCWSKRTSQAAAASFLDFV